MECQGKKPELKWRWEHFKHTEVLSPEGVWVFRKMGLLLAQPYALDALEALRIFTGPLIVNRRGASLRGYRSAEENRITPGAALYSTHIQGIAFDVSGKKQPAEIGLIASTMGWWVKVHETYVHIDLGCRGLTP